MEVPVPAAAPVTFVWLTVQLNVVDPRLLVKLMPVAPASQIFCEEGVAVATGSGFTAMVTDTGEALAQPLADGVMVYTTEPGADVVAVSTCVMLEPDPAVAPEASVCEAVHVNVVPLTLLVKAMPVVAPEQMVAPTGVALTVGVGLTVTVTGGIVAVHPAGVVAVTL